MIFQTNTIEAPDGVFGIWEILDKKVGDLGDFKILFGSYFVQIGFYLPTVITKIILLIHPTAEKD